jgi:hypothetical protein
MTISAGDMPHHLPGPGRAPDEPLHRAGHRQDVRIPVLLGNGPDMKRITWDIPVRPEAVSDIRTRISKTLIGWDVNDASGDNILIASELVTNSLRHGKPEITLTLASAGGRVLGLVADHGAALPLLRPLDETPTSGWGLHLVATLTETWGVTPFPSRPGKTVWWWWPPRHEAARHDE